MNAPIHLLQIIQLGLQRYRKFSMEQVEFACL